MEKFIYEIRPYFFLSLALGALLRSSGSALMLSSGILLLVAASYVVYERLRNRGII